MPNARERLFGVITARAAIMIDRLRRAGVTRGLILAPQDVPGPLSLRQDRAADKTVNFRAARVLPQITVIPLDNRCTAAGRGKLSEPRARPFAGSRSAVDGQRHLT